MIRKYWALLKGNLRITMHEAMMYRANTIFFILFEGIFFVSNFYAVHLGFELAGGSINGWNKGEAFLVSSIFNFTHQLFLTFFASVVFEVGEKAGNGTFDFILLKPHPPLLTSWVTAEWMAQNIPVVFLSGSAMIYIMTHSTNVNVSLLNTLVCLAFVGLGVIVRFALGLLCVSPVFFSERLHAVDTYWSLASIGSYPQAVLPRVIQYLFTFGLPIFLVSSIPAEAFFGMRSGFYLTVTFGIGLVFSYLGFKVFNWSLSHYKSVNAGV